MTAELTLKGIGVSGGIAVAPLFVLPEAADGERAAGLPAQEREALERAIAAAAAELESLMAELPDDGAEILEFQVALLEDEDLLAPIFEAIDRGTPSHRAWPEVLDREIRAYAGEDPGDETFAARASDLTDLRDRVQRQLFGVGPSESMPTEPSILVAGDLAPSRFLEIDAGMIAGIALGAGSRTSHVSLLARARGTPLVVGLGELPEDGGGGEAVLDAARGCLTLHPSPRTCAAAAAQAGEILEQDRRAKSFAAAPAVTAGGSAVTVQINVDHPSILDQVDPSHCDGIGLTRTEFLFQQGVPDEQSQLETYRALLRWAGGRPVTIRTLDAGGDKPLPGITRDGESNPFLGLRGVRLSLRGKDLFKVQLRALLQTAAEGPLKVMVPMVTQPEEIAQVRGLIDEAAEELDREGKAYARPALGMMVEVPAAALAAELFDVDFYSIGTNDLVQYATASARDNAEVAALARPDHPGVLRLIQSVVEAGRRRAVEVSVCGDMASEPAWLDLLLDAGLRRLSVAPATVGQVKAAVSAYKDRSC